MSVVRVLASTRRTYPLVTKHGFEAACFETIADKLLLRSKTGQNGIADIHQEQWRRLLHTTNVKRDMETAFRAIAGGIAATGVIGPGIGVGYIFGSAIQGTARNPSVGNRLLTSAFIGAALCESLGLFALVVSFLTVI